MTALPWLGVTGCLLFVLVFLFDGWTRPGYSPVRHPVSALALGPRGWVQTSSFLVCGLAVTVGAFALAGAFGSVLLAVVVAAFGAAVVASGVFPMDPMRGYPPGTPNETPAEYSTRHRLHDHAGLVVFGALPLAAGVAAFVLPGVGWTWYSALSAAAALGGLLLFGAAWERDDPRAGLVQKITIVVGWSWLGMLFANAAAS